MMEAERDRKIKARAYELWEQGGREDGHADSHWAQATREVGSDEEVASPSMKAAAVKPARATAPRSSTSSMPNAQTGPAKGSARSAKAADAKAPAATSSAALKPAAMAKKPAASARAGAKT